MIEADFNVARGTARIHLALEDSGLILLSGRNGAGKTSSLLCMAGIIPPESGTFRIKGKDVFALPAGKRGVVYINQNSFFSGMSVKDHLKMVSESVEMIDEITSLYSLDPEADTAGLSQGNRMRVSVATAILSSPSLILLDEIVSSISEPEQFLGTLRKSMEKHSFDVVFVSQNESMAELSDHHYVISGGSSSRVF